MEQMDDYRDAGRQLQAPLWIEGSAHRVDAVAPTHAKRLRKKISLEKEAPKVWDGFNLSAHPDWPPTAKRAANSGEPPEDGPLPAPRNTTGSHFTASKDGRRCGSVFERLAPPPLPPPPPLDGKRGAEEETKARRVRGMLVLCANGSVVKRPGGLHTHGGFNEQSVHPVLASRFRWRHACTEALAFGKDAPVEHREKEGSTAVRAHNTFTIVARTVTAVRSLHKRSLEGPSKAETKAIAAALHRPPSSTSLHKPFPSSSHPASRTQSDHHPSPTPPLTGP
ncbi:hypothetical protein T484DRAFT_1921995, partial [Baffinella frigidus]